MLTRSFSSLTAGARRRRNGSSLARHATAAEGKVAHLLFAANLDEPSVRTVPVTRYFPAKPYFTRPRKESNRCCEALELPVTVCARFKRLYPSWSLVKPTPCSLFAPLFVCCAVNPPSIVKSCRPSVRCSVAVFSDSHVVDVLLVMFACPVPRAALRRWDLYCCSRKSFEV